MKIAKMNGLGNEIVILDARERAFTPDEAWVKALADPAQGLGFDQLMVLRHPKSPLADVYSDIWNADGSKVAACGNGARCVAWYVMREMNRDNLVIETEAGLLGAVSAGPNQISIDMGEPIFDWDRIPMSERMDTIRIELQVGPIDDPILHGPGVVSMGNPHCVFFVQDAELAPVREIGPMIEYHPLFPERTNVGFAQIVARNHIRLRVWERGAGLTKACGTGACAALVAAVRRRLADRLATVEVDGGALRIEWRDSDNHVIMTGPVALESEGTVG
ncbi:diaminopimelate epimerase [Candidatus Phycosocius bacilliformis]|uniref:Diaminopimelate epimerase n=2 Tax=Candidatus Phycosocius bacilliformis TaxID=1445552 RepID=A0A2P2EB05_9PROT|nr:diaminopimelate epimerase [Candidatus Phycosocius bacilliformis]GBF58247.1 diaminopimelate epimerase [Candidatus Phycosocius bacilliformis]